MKRKSSSLKKSRISVSSLKKKCWTLFSQYIRLKYADWRGNVECVTCQKTFHWKAIQAGHFIAGHRNMLFFDERNVFPQCYVCNVRKHGDQLRYYRFMVAKFGEETVQELEHLDTINKQFTVSELEELLASLQEKLSRLGVYN